MKQTSIYINTYVIKGQELHLMKKDKKKFPTNRNKHTKEFRTLPIKTFLILVCNVFENRQSFRFGKFSINAPFSFKNRETLLLCEKFKQVMRSNDLLVKVAR